MEGGKSSEQKVESNDVVVSILGIEETSKLENQSSVCRSLETLEPGSSSKNTPIGSPNTGLTELQILKSSVELSTTTSSFNPERTNSGTTHNRNKPSKIPDESVIRRRSLSKPKSRLVEPPYLSVTKLVEVSRKTNASTRKETVKTASVTPKTPLLASLGGEEEEDDEDVYNYKTPYEKSGNKLKGVVLLEWISFVCIMAVLIACSTVDRLQNHTIWSLEIWKWCVLVLVIFCGRLFTGWFINITVFLIERNFLLKKKVLYFVYGLKKSVRVFIWLCLILLAWALLINRGVRRSRDARRSLNYITRALASTLFGAGLWMVKTLLVKLLASSFHVTRFFDRIQDAIFHQHVLWTLSRRPPLMKSEESVGNTNSGRLSFKNLKKDKGDKGEVNVEKLQKMKQEKISAWTMRGLVQVIQGSGLYTISNALEDCVDDECIEQKDKEITSEWEAKAAASQIFENVARPGYEYMDEEDLLRFMKKEEVENVLQLIEGETETRKIKKSSLKKWVVYVYNERKLLVHSLNDTKTAIEELNRILSGIVLLVTIIVWSLLMGFATTHVLVFLSSQLLLVAFIFGNTCKTVFEAIIFVFVMHPFDVGDRCVVDGVQMVVEEMNILTTIFLRYDNEKIFYPNSVLATKPISNFYRSPEMSDAVEFSIDVSTSAQDIVDLKAKIKAYLEGNPQHWRPTHSVQVKDIEDVNKMKMALYITHTMNFQNFVEKSNRRSELVLELKRIFEELKIKYNLLPQEVHLRYVGSAPPTPINAKQ
ncbi:mechanosensitive ion channel protein 10-like [Actinidia eriantha]|uniref:mechanosensitive ion channel protein 10-like n=1 Tax=Actinidia eriantha TaxID=165200 RepID=UPI002586CDE3|nr:mechanosensitive ion channel protein 10-like [Actinidia eriantha]XP_057467410.1 mechanosensitive ion channel protein 10-like [Actinidia eriantha]XP_057467411.1 mechanosensitive ion channel protein 10-like [Actinidia eriantha]XP_057467412.1 mechanosensitive ion channel protein 10-like [Actinidia eriantha]XP_057467413.1 mechanosensitive ion channel protein 10-like [Actinidia eriantha]